MSTPTQAKLSAFHVFKQNDGEVTKAYYAELNALGPAGQVAVALFRAQKRSSAAKTYRRGRWRGAAYDVKAWSMSEAVRLLTAHGRSLGIRWGWKEDPSVLFGNDPAWVLYCDLPTGQVSFHNPTCGAGPVYVGEWDGERGASVARICKWCDMVAGFE
jgi:hypothetical protein